MQLTIPRLVIAAPKSGSGKTTVVLGLLAVLRKRGLKTASFKIGPDYIDTGYHRLASGSEAHNLDSWLMPKKTLKRMFVNNAKDADIAIIEGVMGLYDGGKSGVSSTAEIAKLLDAPVVLVIDAKSMGASAAAVALGFKEYDRAVNIAGVILNRLGSKNHEKIIRSAMSGLAIPVFGAIHRSDLLTVPERHLGLLPTAENNEETLSAITEAVERQVNMDLLLSVAMASSPLPLKLPKVSLPLVKTRIAVAQDEAFNFYYPESMDVLTKQGAQLVPFSPLYDHELPAGIDGVIIGGGFPEMFAEKLAANVGMRESVKRAVALDMPIYAECGGYMYLMNSLRDFEGKEHPMVGVIDDVAQMNDKLQTVGYVSAEMLTETVLGPKGAMLKGHEFHFSSVSNFDDSMAAFSFKRLRGGNIECAGYAKKNILASYLHVHFAGCPEAAEYFIEKCINYGERKNWAR